MQSMGVKNDQHDVRHVVSTTAVDDVPSKSLNALHPHLSGLNVVWGKVVTIPRVVVLVLFVLGMICMPSQSASVNSQRWVKPEPVVKGRNVSMVNFCKLWKIPSPADCTIDIPAANPSKVLEEFVDQKCSTHRVVEPFPIRDEVDGDDASEPDSPLVAPSDASTEPLSAKSNPYILYRECIVMGKGLLMRVEGMRIHKKAVNEDEWVGRKISDKDLKQLVDARQEKSKDYVIVFGGILMLIALCVEGKPSDGVLLAMALFFNQVGIIPDSSIYSGLSSKAVILFGSLFVISAAFQETMVLEKVLSGVVGSPAGYWGIIFRLFVPVMLLSAVCANGPVCSMAMPLVAIAAEKAGFDARNFYLPLAYATSLGGLITPIGSPPNMQVANRMKGVLHARCKLLVQRINPAATPEQLTDKCLFEISDPGFALTGLANCAIGIIFLWVSCKLLAQKYPPVRAVEDKKAAPVEPTENQPLLDAEKGTPAIKAEDQSAKFVCDMVIRASCGELSRSTFNNSVLAIQQGVSLVEIFEDRNDYVARKRTSTGGTIELRKNSEPRTSDGGKAVSYGFPDADAVGGGGDNEIDNRYAVAVVTGEYAGECDLKDRILEPGCILRLSFKTIVQVSKVRKIVPGLEPVSLYWPLLGRKRYKRLLHEIVCKPECNIKDISDEALFKDLRCVKVGHLEKRNVILVEAFSGEIEKEIAKPNNTADEENRSFQIFNKSDVLCVKPTAGTKPPRSVTTTDQARGFIILGMFLLSIILAIVAPFQWAKPLKQFGEIHTSFTMCAIAIVIMHLLPWKTAVGSMSSSVLFTFAFADATADALKFSDATVVLEGYITAAACGQKVLVMLFLFLVLSIVTNFINNNTTSILFAEVAFLLAEANGIPPKPIMCLVVAGSSAAFMTPFGTSCNMFVCEPGGYAFGDYAKSGMAFQVATLVASVSVCFAWAKMEGMEGM